MKTIITITIGDNSYKVESVYDHGVDNIKNLIAEIIKSENLIYKTKNNETNQTTII